MKLQWEFVYSSVGMLCDFDPHYIIQRSNPWMRGQMTAKLHAYKVRHIPMRGPPAKQRRLTCTFHILGLRRWLPLDKDQGLAFLIQAWSICTGIMSLALSRCAMSDQQVFKDCCSRSSVFVLRSLFFVLRSVFSWLTYRTFTRERNDRWYMALWHGCLLLILSNIDK